MCDNKLIQLNDQELKTIIDKTNLLKCGEIFTFIFDVNTIYQIEKRSDETFYISIKKIDIFMQKFNTLKEITLYFIYEDDFIEFLKNLKSNGYDCYKLICDGDLTDLNLMLSNGKIMMDVIVKNIHNKSIHLKTNEDIVLLLSVNTDKPFNLTGLKSCEILKYLDLYKNEIYNTDFKHIKFAYKQHYKNEVYKQNKIVFNLKKQLEHETKILTYFDELKKSKNKNNNL